MISVFYSWQSTLPNKDNRGLIESAINQGISNIKSITLYLDKDTKRETGSPLITSTIFNKIDNCLVFICDVTAVSNIDNKALPNPNVMIELGYAIKTLGWERIICINNLKYSKIEDLPFNIRQNRILSYNSENTKESKEKISIVIQDNINALIEKQAIFDTILDDTKKKIDYCLLQIIGRFSNIFYDFIGMGERLKHFGDTIVMTKEDIIRNLTNKEIIAFFIMDSNSREDGILENIIKEIHSSNYLPKEWLSVCIKIKRWLSDYNDMISQRLNPNLFIKTGKKANELKVIDAQLLNPANSGQILLNSQNAVTNVADLSNRVSLNPLDIIIINIDEIDSFSKHLELGFELVRLWLDLNGGDIILDPDYYKLRDIPKR